MTHVVQEVVRQLLGNRHRGHEVGEDHELADFSVREVRGDVAHRVGHAVRRGLAGDDQLVSHTEGAQQVGVELRRGILRDLDVRLHGRIVLREGLTALGNIVHRTQGSARPVGQRIPDLRHDVGAFMPDAAVLRPHHEVVPAVGLERLDVVLEPGLMLRLDSAPHPGLHVVDGDGRKRRRRLAILSHPHAGVRNVRHLMGVEGQVEHVNLGPDTADEFGHADGVGVGAGHEKRTGGAAEVILPVNAEDV